MLTAELDNNAKPDDENEIVEIDRSVTYFKLHMATEQCTMYDFACKYFELSTRRWFWTL